jgi:hypothetical protein
VSVKVIDRASHGENMPKYLCLQRTLPGAELDGQKPSPAEMQAMYSKFNAWRERFQSNLADIGRRLGAGQLVTAEPPPDGPFVELKELVGGYMIAPSAIHTLNRAVAMAEWRGAIDGLAILEGLQPPSWLVGSYLWAAVLADLHRRCGHDELAKHYRDAAMESAPSHAVKDALSRRLRTAHS